MSTEISRSRLKIEGLDRTSMFQLHKWSAQDPTPFSIEDLIDMSEEPTQEKWFYIMKDEVTVRLANQIMELLSVPQGLGQEIMFRKILQQHVQSFIEIVGAKDLKFSDKTNRKLVETLFYLRRRHEMLIPDMSEAIQRHRVESAMTSDNSMTAEGIQYLLDRLFTTKISLALLISVYDAVHCRNKQALESLVTRRCDVMKIIEEAHDRASTVCETSYMEFADLS